MTSLLDLNILHDKLLDWCNFCFIWNIGHFLWSSNYSIIIKSKQSVTDSVEDGDNESELIFCLVVMCALLNMGRRAILLTVVLHCLLYMKWSSWSVTTEVWSYCGMKPMACQRILTILHRYVCILAINSKQITYVNNNITESRNQNILFCVCWLNKTVEFSCCIQPLYGINLISFEVISESHLLFLFCLSNWNHCHSSVMAVSSSVLIRMAVTSFGPQLSRPDKGIWPAPPMVSQFYSLSRLNF